MLFDVKLANEIVPTDALVLRLEGWEALNRIPRWVLDVASPDELDPQSILRTSAQIWLHDNVDALDRTIHGVVSSVRVRGLDDNLFVYRIEVRPEESLLELCAGYRVLIERTVPEMVADILKEEGLGGDRLKPRLLGTYAPRPYTVQHGEPHWSFLERLLADEGISYWFDTGDAGPVLILCDGLDALDATSGRATLGFQESQGGKPVRRMRTLQQRLQVGFEGTHLVDYDPRQPNSLVDAAKGDPGSQYFEYPASVIRGLANSRAQVRLEQLQGDHLLAFGQSDCLRLQPGRKVEIQGCTETDSNGQRVILAVHHYYARRGGANVAHAEYGNDVTLADAKVPPRPSIAPRHRVSGIDLGFTTGPSGEEIHVNDQGCVTVRFPWDRSGRSDNTSSYWARTVQLPLGGSMILPRVGWEVAVMYNDGDPDYPIVVGRAYNPSTAAPYGLPDRKATTSFQTASSPYDGTTNELRMSDDAGSQEMYLHASRDQTVFVGGSSTLDVTLNETHDVGQSYTLAIQSNQTHTVGAQRAVTIGTDHTNKVNGARLEAIAAVDLTKVSGNRTIASSSVYVEVVGGMYGIQCNQLNTDVTGGYAQIVLGYTAHIAGLGCSETVLGGRAIRVSGAEPMKLRKDFSEKTKGPKRSTIGNVKVKASADMGVKHKGTAKVKVGGAAKVKAGGTVSVTAPKIQINVKGALKAPGLKLSGGTLKVTKGTSKLDGTIKRKGGSRLG